MHIDIDNFLKWLHSVAIRWDNIPAASKKLVRLFVNTFKLQPQGGGGKHDPCRGQRSGPMLLFCGGNSKVVAFLSHK